MDQHSVINPATSKNISQRPSRAIPQPKSKMHHTGALIAGQSVGNKLKGNNQVTEVNQGTRIALGIIRRPFYIHRAQLSCIDEICRKRQKPRSQVFLEAVQLYIGSYRTGEV